jgi:hypothetical protein
MDVVKLFKCPKCDMISELYEGGFYCNSDCCGWTADCSRDEALEVVLLDAIPTGILRLNKTEEI